jgi:hypothetical protein
MVLLVTILRTFLLIQGRDINIKNFVAKLNYQALIYLKNDTMRADILV